MLQILLRRDVGGDGDGRPGRAALIAAATSSQGPILREEITTWAPCSARRSAIALPIPREEPVTMATLPVRSNSSGGLERTSPPVTADMIALPRSTTPTDPKTIRPGPRQVKAASRNRGLTRVAGRFAVCVGRKNQELSREAMAFRRPRFDAGRRPGRRPVGPSSRSAAISTTWSNTPSAASSRRRVPNSPVPARTIMASRSRPPAASTGPRRKSPMTPPTKAAPSTSTTRATCRRTVFAFKGSVDAGIAQGRLAAARQ